MKRILAISLVLLTVLSFVACGLSPEEEIQSYIDNAPEAITTLENQMKDSGMGLEVKAKGTSMVFSCKFNEQLEINDELKSVIQEALKAGEVTMKPALQEAQAECSVLESIVLEYLNKDGTVIAAYEYK